MAAPTLVGTATTGSGIAGGTLAWPSGHQSGDVAFLFIETDSGDATVTVSGWTAISGSPVSVTGAGLGTGQDSKFNAFYKVASSSSEAGATWSDPGDHWVAGMVVARGADVSGSPIAFSQTGTSDASSATTITFPSFTSSGDDNLVIAALCNTDDNTGSITVSNFCSEGTGASFPISFVAANGNDGGLNVVTGTIPTSGTTYSTATYTIGGSRGGVSRNGEGIFVIGVKALGVSPISGTDSFSFGQSADLKGTGELQTSTPVTFGQGGTLVGLGTMAASAALLIGHAASIVGTGALAASTAGVTFGSTATSSGYAYAAASEPFSFSGTATGVTTQGTAGFASLIFRDSATLRGVGALAASVPLNFAQTAGVSGTGLMQASMPFSFSQTATGRVDAYLTGTSSLVFGGSGVPSGTGALAATNPFAFGQSGVLVGIAGASGSSALTFGHSATGAAGAFMLGSAGITFGGSGSLNGGTSSAGSTFLNLSQTATLRGTGRLIGSAPSVFSLMGTGKTRAYVVGSTTMTFGQSGALISIVNPIYGDTWRNKWLAVYNTRQLLLNKIADVVKGIADSKIKTYFTDTAPTVDLTIGDMWFNTITKVLKRWNGTAWVDTVDSTTAVVGTAFAIRNPEFEQGLTDWQDEAGGTVWTTEAGQGYISGAAAKVQSASFSGDRYLIGWTYVPCRAGMRQRIGVMVKRTGGAAGVPVVGITWLGASGYISQSESLPIVAIDNEYVYCWAEGEAPAGTTQYRVFLGVRGYAPSAAWYFDSVKRDTFDEIAAVRQSNDNYLVNFDFEGGPYVNTDSTFTGLGYDPNVLPPNWVKNAAVIAAPTWVRYDYDNEYEGTRSLLMSGAYNSGIFYGTNLPCAHGDRLSMAAALKGELSGSAQLMTAFYAADGAYLSEESISNGATLGTWVVESKVMTAPAGVASARLFFRQGNATASWCAVDRIRLGRALNIDREVSDGTDYVRYGIEDSWEYMGKRRVGLRIAGSTHRIGDQRNLPQSNTTAYGSIRSTTALTADNSGNVTVNAHTVRYGGVNVSYSVVTNAVTGLTVGNTYVIYCFDDNYAGGTRTWYAGTNPDAVMQLGDGVVVAGQVTIPATGTSGGGGGGGGADPDGWCVDYDTVLPDGRLVRDLKPGDLVGCINVVTGEVDYHPLLAMTIGEADCYRLVTTEGHSVVQSLSTPMDLPDGTVCFTPAMRGKPVYIPGRLTQVVSLEFVGRRPVCKPDLGNRMFFAGESADRTIATHNIKSKP